MTKWKELCIRHFNCLPWFVCGLMVMIDGNISRWEYGCLWIAILLLIWWKLPIEVKK